MGNNFLFLEIFKSLIHSFNRVFTIILAIFIATSVSGAFLNIYFDLENKFSHELKAYGANLTISPLKGNLISNDEFLKIEKELGQKGVTPYLYEFFNVDGNDALVLGTNFSSLKITKPFIESVQGSFSLSDFKDNSAFVGYDLALKMISGNKQLSLKSLINKEIQVFNANSGKSTKLVIKGVIRSSDELDSLLLAPLNVVQDLSGELGVNYAYALVYGNFDEVSAKASSLSDDKTSLKPISSISLSESLVLNKLKALMFLIILVVLIISSTSVNTTLSAIILARKKEIALHLALGAKKSDVIKLFGLECLVLTVFASILGIAFGYVLANIFGKLVFDSSIDFRFLAAFIAFLLSLVFAFIASIIPIKKALKINVCENLKGE